MLIRTCRNTEPAVVGHVDDPARPLARRHDFACKNDLIADERQRQRSARDGDEPVAIAGEEAAALPRQLLEAEPLEKMLERQIFAERNKMHLIIERRNRTAVIDDVNR